MRLRILFLLCSLLNCSLAFDECITANKDNVIQEPRHLEVNSGENAVINCTVKGFHIKGANMRKRFKKIVFLGPEGNSTDTNYQDRLSLSGHFTHFSVTLKNLTENDSEIYLCDVLTVGDHTICSHGTLLIVRPSPKVEAANEEQTCGKNSFSPIPYIIISVLLVLCMVVFSIYMNRKRSKEKHNINQSTYVDMTQTLRRNTMGNSYIYNQTQNGSVPT